jgi:hypothetical protein
VLAVTYDAACQAAFVKHLEGKNSDVVDMVHAKRKSIVKEQGFLATIKVGDWVDVESDYSPGLNSDGGIGCVYGLHEETVLGEMLPRKSALDIHYVIFIRKERGVALRRCVVIPMPFKANTPSLRVRKKESPTVIHTVPPDRTPLEWLKHGLESNRHTKPGWLRDLLLQHNLFRQDDKNSMWQRVLSDYQCQLSYLEGLAGALGEKYLDPRQYHGKRGKDSCGRYISMKKAIKNYTHLT